MPDMHRGRGRLAVLVAVVSLALAADVDDPPKNPFDVDALRRRLKAAVARLCDAEQQQQMRQVAPAEAKQACKDARRFLAALAEAGTRLSPHADDSWAVLEGDALRQHPDPLGALQRGEVPAVMLRRFVPQQELDAMRSRMAGLTLRVFACRFGRTDGLNATARKAFSGTLVKMRTMRVDSNDPVCQELNEYGGRAKLTWPAWCTLLANVRDDCARQRSLGESPECRALREAHPVFDRCAHDYGKKRQIKMKFKVDRVVKAAARELGSKLYGNLQTTSKDRYMLGATAIDLLHDLAARGCTGRFCSPKQAMLAGISELARQRGVRQAQEVGGERHSPGTIRAMTHGWITPLHMDSKHSNAWAALRRELCNEKVILSMGTSHVGASRFEALTRHHFAASAIFTMHEPDRTLNPFDLHVFRTRWPALLYNCSVLTVDAYGVGARFQRDTMPPFIFEQPVKVTGRPGDLFLFNSEYFHDTPRITGKSSRTVFNSFAGYSADQSNPVELYA